MQTSDVVAYFSKYIERELGIIYSEHNLYQLQNRLEEFIKIVGIPDLKSLREDAEMNNPRFNKQLLLDISTNNETTFFRDLRVFTGMSQLFEKTLIDGEISKEKIKIWSAASSTGQEAISISILLEEILSCKKYHGKYSILCSDISERVLKRAQEGIYSEFEVSRGLSENYLTKYFNRENDKYKVASQIMNNLSFVKQNIKESFIHLGKFNFVICRNVLIYQNIDSKIEILRRISNSILPGGYLVLGAGESLIGLSDDFEQEIVEGAVFYRKKK